MASKNLIVLSGEAGAGKDSVADHLAETHGWIKFSLSAPMKRFCADMFGFTDEQLYGPSSARNAPDHRWMRPCPRCNKTGMRPSYNAIPGSIPTQVRCDDCNGTGIINDNSPRRILMLMGEEFLRQMIHVDALTMRAAPEIKRLLETGQKIVVNDARNDNDRDNLHKWLGASRVDVRSIRTIGRKKTGWRAHISENRQPKDDEVDYIIKNDEEWPFPSLPGLVKEMLQKLP